MPSPANTAPWRAATAAACSTTPTSATAASPCCARCACASRSPGGARALPRYLSRTVRRPAGRARRARRRGAAGLEPGLGRCAAGVQDLPDEVGGWAKGAKGTAQKKIFRDCFTTVDPEAAPVIARHHKIEPLDLAALFPGQTPPAGITKDPLYAFLACTRTARASTSSTKRTRR